MCKKFLVWSGNRGFVISFKLYPNFLDIIYFDEFSSFGAWGFLKLKLTQIGWSSNRNVIKIKVAICSMISDQ